MIDINLQIEKVVREKSLSYIDASIKIAEEKDIEMQYLATFLNRSIKEKVQYEAEERNLLKTNTIRLPI